MARRALILLVGVALIAALAVWALDPSDGVAPPRATAAAVEPAAQKPSRPETQQRRTRRAKPDREPAKIPTADAIKRASEFAAEREGAVSFATVNSDGKLGGRSMGAQYAAASVVKAMLLAAETRRLADAPIDASTESLLRTMVTHSDNEAADAIYSRVGDAGLHAVAKRAGMTGFEIAGHWGNAQISAGDMALFFADLDDAFPERHRRYAKGLLGSVVAEQRWGIPQTAGEDWAVRFKGGWLPDHALVHQAAELRERGGERVLSIAVLTDMQPSHEYGVATVRGVAERLLEG